MLTDRYDNPLTTSSQAARDAYVAGLDLLLAGQADPAVHFARAVEHDPDFALGWSGLARAQQFCDDMAGARSSMKTARACQSSLTSREASQVAAFDLMMSGQNPQAYSAIRAHVDTWPRDAIVAGTCSSVFGLIGFSGQPGREAETLAFVAGFLPHYGEDWWAISQYAFALCETGNLTKADTLIDKALALRPDNAHGAHVRSHISYEMGETDLGRQYLAGFMSNYDPRGVMFTHLNWHEALWALEQGDVDAMWRKVDDAVAPEAGSSSPAINVLTDTAAILHRATMAGVPVAAHRWEGVSDYAMAKFPRTGNSFIDVHAALAHAMAGRQDALARIMDQPKGFASDLVPDLAAGFQAMADENWVGAANTLTRAMSDLARIGGSRAQRDMVEQSLLLALVKQGKRQEARDIAVLRRPLLANTIAA